MNLPRILIILALMLLLFSATSKSQTVDVYGQVRIWSGNPSWGEGVNGVTVMLYDTWQTVFYTDVTHTDSAFWSQHPGLTSPDGIYYFDDVPYSTDYWVEIIPPDGFTLATNPEQGSWWNANPREVGDDFYRCFLLLYEAHTIGFWKAQAKKAITGKGNAQVSPDELNQYLDDIYTQFDGGAFFPVEDVSSVGIDPLTYEDAYDTFQLPNGGPSGMVNKAKKQLLAVLLDVAAGWVLLDEVISNDGRTVTEAIAFTADMINTNGDDLEDAKNACDYINNNQVVTSGWIPSGYEWVIYGNKIVELSGAELLPARILAGNYPNPFNPETRIEFSLPEASEVSLTIYNLQGQIITELLSNRLEAGQHQVTWNASNHPSGIYLYRLSANDAVLNGRMVLVK